MSLNTTRRVMAVIAPIHAGEVLLEEFLEPLGVTPVKTLGA